MQKFSFRKEYCNESTASFETTYAIGTYKIAPAAAREAHHARTGELTPREREVLTMVAQGYTNKEIASVLEITVKTVESHKSNAMEKLEIRSRAELVRFALAQGWLSAQ